MNPEESARQGEMFKARCDMLRQEHDRIEALKFVLRLPWWLSGIALAVTLAVVQPNLGWVIGLGLGWYLGGKFFLRTWEAIAVGRSMRRIDAEAPSPVNETRRGR